MDRLCQEFQESYGETALTDGLKQHAATCRSCAAFVQKQDALQDMLAQWNAPETREDFALDVMSRIAEEEHTPLGLWDLLKQMVYFRISIPLPVGALASVILIVSLGFNLMVLNQEPSNHSGNTNITQIPQPTPAMPQTIQNNAIVPIPASNPGAMLSQQWVGSGAFLMIPIVNPNETAMFGLEETNTTQKQQDI